MIVKQKELAEFPFTPIKHVKQLNMFWMPKNSVEVGGRERSTQTGTHQLEEMYWVGQGECNCVTFHITGLYG